MRASVDFQDERLELDLPDDLIVGTWEGPRGFSAEALQAAIRDVIERPLDFPPFSQMFVPGDRITIALDASLSGVRPILDTLRQSLHDSGIIDDDISVVATLGAQAGIAGQLPERIKVHVHTPDDSSQMAYLATTEHGRRIYLDRRLTDADVVIPLGRLGYDPILGYRGPWSTIFPEMSDRDTASSYRSRLTEDAPDRATPRTHLDETLEVGWLLGSQFHLGFVPGVTGIAEPLAGLVGSVRDRGIQAVDRRWSFRPRSRAETVVAGIGRPGVPTTLDDLVEGLVTASRLVDHGGRIVALSRAAGSIGPSLQRLIEAGDPRNAPAALRGHDSDLDSVIGRRLATVLAWADVYLLSNLDRSVVEDLSMIPFEHAEDARRLVAGSPSTTLVSRAELTRATVQEG